MASTIQLTFENILDPSLLDVAGQVTMAEEPDVPGVIGSIDSPTPGTPAPPLTPSNPPTTPSVLAQFNLQKDQPLCFVFQWTQTGWLTTWPWNEYECNILEWNLSVFFEQLGSQEVSPALDPTATVPFYGGAGHTYNEVIKIEPTPPMPNPLPEGLYKVYARLTFGPKGQPNTPIAALAELAMLNVYTF